MGRFDDTAVPEVDEEDLRLTRDRRGRLALSRPSLRRKVPGQANTIPTNVKASSAVIANSTKVLAPRTPEATPKMPVSTNSMAPAQHEQISVDDPSPLALQSDGTSSGDIDGKLDKGKDMTAMQAHPDEVAEQEKGGPEGQPEIEGQSDEKAVKSPGKKGKNKKGKGKADNNGSESDKGSKKSDKEGKKGEESIVVLQGSSKKNENEASDQGRPANTDDKEAATLLKEGYVGTHGRGEVRFVDGVPVMYRHSGTNAEQLDAEMVAIIYREAAKHDRNKWLTVVSRFFDKTGIRLDPEVARIALESP